VQGIENELPNHRLRVINSKKY